MITSASMMCMDPINIARDMETLEPYIDVFHADVMDDHYGPNLAMSLDTIQACVKATEKPVETHLMVMDPRQWIDGLIDAGVRAISIHAEVINAHAFRTLNRIREGGCEVGIVLNPATPLEICLPYLDLIDLITIMTVDVGYAGQAFIPQVVPKIETAPELREKHRLNYRIQVDGACNASTYEQTMRAGAESFVMGSSGLFGLDPDLAKAAQLMQEQIRQAADLTSQHRSGGTL